ncbi:MAG: Lrp/AsnC family transcriptional regulator [Candidatus Bathyarchaeota archaeon]|nr:Lrp/AsnC family transcriptional regulator [Candidatus Bathyarchaeota archaeon]
MELKLDDKDLAILKVVQKNAKLGAREIAGIVHAPITTVFAKIKRMEKLGIIKEYRAVLDSNLLNAQTTAFILASVTYRMKDDEVLLSQREIARKIASFLEVQEVHIIAGDWDLLIKVKGENVDAVGRFIIDKLRLIKGIEKTLTCMVFETCKETSEIPIAVLKMLNNQTQK